MIIYVIVVVIIFSSKAMTESNHPPEPPDPPSEEPISSMLTMLENPLLFLNSFRFGRNTTNEIIIGKRVLYLLSVIILH